MVDYRSCKIDRLPALGDLEVVDVAFHDVEFGTHFHETFTFGVVTGGRKVIEYGCQTHIVRPGGVILMAPNELHAVRGADSSGWRNLMLYPSPAMVADMLDCDDVAHLRFTAAVVEDGHLCHAVKRAAHTALSKASLLEKETALADMILMATTRYGENSDLIDTRSAPKSNLKRAFDYLHDNVCENVGLSDLAAIAGCGRFKIINAFKDHVGMPPHAYQVQLRIALAQRMLRRKESVVNVAMACGFFDQSHFNRHFKKHVGVPPRYYQLPISIVSSD